MPSIGTYAGINAKVRTLRSTTLSPEQTLQLAHSRDIHELYTLLLQHGIGSGRKEHGPPSQVTVAAIEHMVHQDELFKIGDIEKGSRGLIRDLIRFYIERFDIMVVKQVMRHLHSGVPGTDLSFPLFGTRFLDVLGPMSGITTMQQLAETLEPSPYSRILSERIESYRQDGSIFSIEIALDQDLFKRTRAFGLTLDKKDKKLLEKMLGLETDLLNLSWVHRFRHYYKLTPAEIKTLLLPGGRYFTTDRLASALESQDLSGLLQEILKGVRISIPDDQETSGMALVETFLYRVLLNGAKASFMAFPFSIGAVIGYLYLLKTQTRNLITLLNGIEYKMTPESLESLLVQ